MGTRVVAIKKDGKALLVMVRKGQTNKLATAFTVWRIAAGDKSGKLNARQAIEAVKWVKKKGWTPRLVRRGNWCFIARAEGVTLPGDHELLSKLNHVGHKMKRIVYVKSGYRNHREQWELRMKYVRFKLGMGPYANLAARCCLKYDMTVHSWDQCGKQSQSNHSRPPKGHAVDCGLLMATGYMSIGHVNRARKLMRKFGLCLPVPGEAWHVQKGFDWRA